MHVFEVRHDNFERYTLLSQNSSQTESNATALVAEMAYGLQREQTSVSACEIVPAVLTDAITRHHIQ